MNNISFNKVNAATRIAVAELISKIPVLGIIIPLLFVLFAYILEDDLPGISAIYNNMSMIALCLIVMVVYKNILVGTGVMRKSTLPMTHNEKFVTLIICTLITILVWILYIGIIGGIIFTLIGVNQFNLSVTDSLICSVSPLLSAKMIVYIFYMAMILLLSVTLSMPKHIRKPLFIQLIIMVALLIAGAVIAAVINMPWIIIAYTSVAIILCIIQSYRNIRNIQSF